MLITHFYENIDGITYYSIAPTHSVIQKPRKRNVNIHLIECVSFSSSLMNHFLSCLLKIRWSCGLQVESLLQPSVWPHPQTQLGQHCFISTEPRAQSGDDIAEEKDPIAPVSEGLDPLFAVDLII